MKRYALVALSGSDTVDAVARYLPGNYEVIGVAEGTFEVFHTPREGRFVVVAGTDNCGWTLHDYVMPRLASGLYPCAEIDLSHPVMKEVRDETSDS